MQPSDQFFVTLNETSLQPAILLVDASGSVRSDWKQNGGQPQPSQDVWNQMLSIIKNKLPESSFRVIFWNSENITSNGQFVKGLKIIPYVVDKAKVSLLFAMTKDGITDPCLTMPHLAFDSIPESWFKDKDGALVPTKIYLVTDGQIYGGSLLGPLELQQKLAQSIKSLTEKYITSSIEIITAENAIRDYKEQETLQQSAGSDVYKVIMNQGLTTKITKFTSYAYNHLQGFVHISRRNTPPGYIPWGDQMFREASTADFISWINYKIRHEAKTEEEFISLVQKLSTTLSVLTKKKPLDVKKAMLRLFSNMFQNTVLDSGFVLDVLTDAIEKENQGQAQLYATYRTQLKDLYKISTQKLLSSTKDALHIPQSVSQSCMTFPIQDLSSIFICYEKMIEQDLYIGKTKYRKSGIEINDALLPILPFPILPPEPEIELEDKTKITPMKEQCLRQWVRAICASLFDINQSGDHPIYLVLILNMMIGFSKTLSKEIQTSWKNLVLIMLAKKRAQSMQTELDYLKEGNFPVPSSGKVEQFPRLMIECMRKFTSFAEKSTDILPMTFWFALCCGAQDAKLVETQWIHCKEDVRKNFPFFTFQESSNFLEFFFEKYPLSENNTWTFEVMPMESKLDYTCPITMEDTSAKGGHIIAEHKSSVGEKCSPQVVFSHEAYQDITNQNTASLCVYCLVPIDRFTGYKKVDPEPKLPEFKNFLRGDKKEFSIFTKENETNKNHVETEIKKSDKQKAKQVKNSQNGGIIVFLKGILACGKSTFALKLSNELKKLGHHPIIEGIDQYAKQGLDYKAASPKVKQSLTEALRLQKKLRSTQPDQKVFVIMDTCGTKNVLSNVFGINFSHWKSIEIWVNYEEGTNPLSYLAWSCRNLMERKAPHYPEDNFALNPQTSTFETCLNVFTRKTNELFKKGNKTTVPFPFTSPVGVQDCLAQVQHQAHLYEEVVKKLDAQFNHVLQKCLALV